MGLRRSDGSELFNPPAQAPFPPYLTTLAPLPVGWEHDTRGATPDRGLRVGAAVNIFSRSIPGLRGPGDGRLLWGVMIRGGAHLPGTTDNFASGLLDPWHERFGRHNQINW